MPFSIKPIRAYLIIPGLLALAAPLARALPTGEATPRITVTLPGGAGGPVQDRLLAERARLKTMEQVAWGRNPDLRRVEGAYLALREKLRQEQAASRKAIDEYLQKHSLSQADLGRFKLKEITDLMMKILPAEVVGYPELKTILPTAIRQGPPPFPAEWKKQFPGKRPAEVPSDALLAFYQAQLKAEATRSGQALRELLKDAPAPEFMVQSMQMLTRMKCVQIIYREYLRAATPPELTRQRALVSQLEKQAQPQGQGITIPLAGGE